MLLRIAIIALGALCCLVSGCGGCSKEPKPPVVDDGIPPRMKDPAYTNQLVQLQRRQKTFAAQIAALKSKIEGLGAEAKGKPEYADLTNRLAQCEAELERVRKETLLTVRTRLLKDASKKDNLKK